MKKSLIPLLFVLFSISLFSQEEKFPIYEGCENKTAGELMQCFREKLTLEVITNINLPEVIKKDSVTTVVNVVYFVTKEGDFKVLQVNTPYEEFEKEVKRVFDSLPKVTPAKYNNHNIEMQFVLPIHIPLNPNQGKIITKVVELPNEEDLEIVKADSLNLLEHHSQLNMPYTHSGYAMLDYHFAKGKNSHTAVKPYVYSEIETYVDLDKQKSLLMKDESSWLGKKLWNEHLFQVEGKDFWFTVDPLLDLQIGIDNSDLDYTYNNTRGLQIQGALGKKMSFSTTIYESQGRFPDYVNRYAESLKASGGNPAIIPGRGLAKRFKTDAYDYPVAEAYISYTANKYFNFQMGHGKNFIGDGYRSVLLSDIASAYPFFKINTSFWKIKYTNIWMSLRDVRPEVTVEGVFKTKFTSMHYLSWNVTKKLNIGLFESVIWDDTNGRGFDFSYMNPIIFYHSIEFSTGSRSGNALIGLSGKYKFNDQISMYTQLMLDEMTIGEVGSGDGYWGNKNGFQIGAKYHDAFGVKNLYLQAEYNSVRPFTYSHNFPTLNYGHANQPLAHSWGGNFYEVVGIANYNYKRWYGKLKVNVGEKGFDIVGDAASYGGDIYRDYSDRAGDYGQEIGQGNTTNIFIGDLQTGYLVNPATNLKIFGGFTFRSFNPESINPVFESTNSTWVNLGLRTDLFDWSFDF
ncbi:MAG: gliding motility protein RemB [Flavobacteriaceae bacterium]|nr:gliding motility protein RemB [Flavobacteriaceae bacterium]